MKSIHLVTIVVICALVYFNHVSCKAVYEVKHGGSRNEFGSKRKVQLQDRTASDMSGSTLSEFLKSVFEVLGVDELNLKQVRNGGGSKVYEFEGKEENKYDYSYYSSYGSYQDDSSYSKANDAPWSNNRDHNIPPQYNSKSYQPSHEQQPPAPAPYVQNYNSQPSSPVFAKQPQLPPISQPSHFNNQPAPAPSLPSYNYQQQINAPNYNNQHPPAPNYNSQLPAAPHMANQNLPPNLVNRDNFENFRFCGKQFC